MIWINTRIIVTNKTLRFPHKARHQLAEEVVMKVDRCTAAEKDDNLGTFPVMQRSVVTTLPQPYTWKLQATRHTRA